jgi:hypothetical protein
VIAEENLLGSFATTVKDILADNDNIIQGELAPQGTIAIKAVYDAGKVCVCVRVCVFARARACVHVRSHVCVRSCVHV